MNKLDFLKEALSKTIQEPIKNIIQVNQYDFNVYTVSNNAMFGLGELKKLEKELSGNEMGGKFIVIIVVGNNSLGIRIINII